MDAEEKSCAYYTKGTRYLSATAITGERSRHLVSKSIDNSCTRPVSGFSASSCTALSKRRGVPLSDVSRNTISGDPPVGLEVGLEGKQE